MLTWAETVAVHFTPKINNYVFLCSCHRNNQAEEDFPHNMTDNLVGEGFSQVLSIHWWTNDIPDSICRHVISLAMKDVGQRFHSDLEKSQKQPPSRWAWTKHYIPTTTKFHRWGDIKSPIACSVWLLFWGYDSRSWCKRSKLLLGWAQQQELANNDWGDHESVHFEFSTWCYFYLLHCQTGLGWTRLINPHPHDCVASSS